MKREEILIHTAEVKVRVMVLPPGDATTWHSHTEVTDHMVALSGRILVSLRHPEETRELQPGERCQVAVGRVHRVANGSTAEPASYLLIQGVGRYDYQSEQS